MAEGPLPAYRAMIDSGQLKADSMQRLAAEKLQLLWQRLGHYDSAPGSRGLTNFIFPKKSSPPNGLYIFGGVGRGKTMLMDMFFQSVSFEPRGRFHFHEFMSETHELIAKARKFHNGDPIPHVARDIAQRARLLCFDELHVTDIADAMILGRLFTGLFKNGVVVIATSNAAPWELYKDGLNRDLFLPFIELLQSRMEVMQLEAAKDYRLEKFQDQKLYLSPLGLEAQQGMDSVWRNLTGVRKGEPATIESAGRQLLVPEAHLGVARFSFDDLCGKPLGSADYVRIVRQFHTIFVDNIPIMGPEQRDKARRFINLIDTIYDNGVRLVASADADPSGLYVAGDGVALFERTVSRLTEMRSAAYVAGREPLTELRQEKIAG